MNKEHLIEKIKKLLALATDNSTTEHEKSSAMNRAQELMAEYSIEECDLQFTNVQDLIVKEKITIDFKDHVPTMLQDPIVLSSIIAPICQNFGCYNYFQGFGPIGAHYVMGFKTNVEVSKYACDVLINQGIQDFKVGFKIHRSIGYGINFWTGFRQGLTERFAKISNEKALVLYDKVQEEWKRMVTIFKTSTSFSLGMGGNQEGIESAKKAQLNPAVSSSKGGLLK